MINCYRETGVFKKLTIYPKFLIAIQKCFRVGFSEKFMFSRFQIINETNMRFIFHPFSLEANFCATV
jgi:hypothetical protein